MLNTKKILLLTNEQNSALIEKISAYMQAQGWQYQIATSAQDFSQQEIAQADFILLFSDTKNADNQSLSPIKGKVCYRLEKKQESLPIAEIFDLAFAQGEIFTGGATTSFACPEEDTHLGKCAVKKGAHRTAIIVSILILFVFLIGYFY